MKGGVDISLIGDKELIRRFNALPAKAEKKVFRQAARKVAKMILVSAKQKCPVRTGALKESLKVKAMKRSRNRIGILIGSGSDEPVLSGDTFYSAFVELGTKKTAAKSFLRPALEQNRARGMEMLREEIGKGVEREAKAL